MALKAMLKNLDQLPDATKALYRKDGEGDKAVYVLDVEAVDGFALENVSALKSSLVKERENVTTLQGQVSAFKDIDPVKAREALDKVEAMKTWSSDDKVKEQLEQHGKTIAAAKDAEITQLKTKLEGVTKGYEAVTIERALIDAATKHQFVSPALAPKLFRESVKLHDQDGKLIPVVIGEDGKPKQKANNDGTVSLVSIEDFVGEQVKLDEFKPLIKGNTATGTRGPSQPDSRSSQQKYDTPLHMKRQEIDTQLGEELLKASR